MIEIFRTCCICRIVYGEVEPLEDKSATHGYCPKHLLEAWEKLERELNELEKELK